MVETGFSPQLTLTAAIVARGGFEGVPARPPGDLVYLQVTGRKPAAVVVPEQSVVLRPAGKVVYIVADGKARQRIVEPGVKQGGKIEIVKGLAPGEVVAE